MTNPTITQATAEILEAFRTLKLARTIADLIGAERIETAHLAEAIQYRPRWQV